jgi:hypothetical protein
MLSSSACYFFVDSATAVHGYFGSAFMHHEWTVPFISFIPVRAYKRSLCCNVSAPCGGEVQAPCPMT